MKDPSNGEMRLVDLKSDGRHIPSRKSVARVIPKNTAAKASRDQCVRTGGNELAITASGTLKIPQDVLDRRTQNSHQLIKVNLTLGNAKHPGHGRPNGASNTVCAVMIPDLTDATSSSYQSAIR